MNKVILAAIAASFVSTAASAHSVQLPTEGQVCSDIHSNISVGINNPELSDYRKCVMIVHGIDTAKTYKTLWVRTGDHFTSFVLDDLRKMDRGERIDYISESIAKAQLEAALNEQREELEMAHVQAIVDLSKAHSDELQAAAMVVADLTTKLANVEAAIVNLEETHKVALEIATATARAEGVASVDITTDNGAAYDNGLNAISFGIAESILLKTGTITYYGQTFDYDAATSRVERDQVIRDFRDFISYEVKWNDPEIITHVINDAIQAELETLLEETYQQGYDAGHRDGYLEGYADGEAGNASKY